MRRFFAAGGNHGTLIEGLGEADREAAYALLGGWLGVTPKPAPPPARRTAPALPWQRRWLDEGRR